VAPGGKEYWGKGKWEDSNISNHKQTSSTEGYTKLEMKGFIVPPEATFEKKKRKN